MARPLTIGLYQMQDLQDPMVVARAERDLQVPINLLSFYRAWGSASIQNDAAWLSMIAASPRQVMLTWEPWRLPENHPPAIQPDFRLQAIFGGAFDAYVRAVASTLRRLDRPVLLRPMHEMNGDWYPWCGTANENRPGDYQKAWHHLHRLFRDEGARNVQWVWCPYVASFPDEPRNTLETYFPGDDVVDFVALDGFNWGLSQSWSRWQTFEELFAPAYERLVHLSDRPVMLAEVGCAESGGDKAQWIADGAATIEGRMPRIITAVWFNENKETDWRVTSSAPSLRSFQQHWAYLAS